MRMLPVTARAFLPPQRLEQDLSHQSLQLHQAEVQKLRKQLSDSKSRCQQLEDSLKQRRIERASLELLYMEYEVIVQGGWV